MSQPTTAEILNFWRQLPPGDQVRLLGFAKALVEQRTGKRAQRQQRHHPRPP